MKPDSARDVARIEMATHGILHLLLKIAQIFSLGGDAAATGGVPRRNQHAGFVFFDLKDNFFHSNLSTGIQPAIDQRQRVPAPHPPAWTAANPRGDVSKIKAIASRRFARHASRVLPCPLAPGTSAQ